MAPSYDHDNSAAHQGVVEMKTLKLYALPLCCLLLIVAIAMMIYVAPKRTHISTYIETERGLVSFAIATCVLGMLTNADGVNILDENSKPITCTGYVKLTEDAYNMRTRK